MEAVKNVQTGVAECITHHAMVGMDSLKCFRDYPPDNLEPFAKPEMTYVDDDGKLCVIMRTGCNTHPNEEYYITMQYRDEQWVFMSYQGMTEYYDLHRWTNPKVEVGFALVMAFNDFLRGLDNLKLL